MVWGIMGGSFDPIHQGHVFMAACAMRHMALSGVLFIPTGDPPHKSRLAKATDRLMMVELAIADNPAFRACDMEIRRAATTYTVDTLHQLHDDNPADEYVYIVGADTLLVIETWRTFEQVPGLLKAVCCVPRPGVELAEVEQQAAHLKSRHGLTVFITPERGPDLSSTDVRLRVERGLPTEGMVPDTVAQYIERKGLYRDPMLDELRRTLTPERYRHTLGVEQAALLLAQQNGVDPGKARVAALLHDCAKCMGEREMLRLLRDHGQEPRHPADRTRTLMHAAAGVIVAKERYDVTDADILSAIRWHTTGRANMSKLEKLIYLADVIEPGRRPFPALPAIRAAAHRSLDEALKMAAERTLAYLDQRGVLPDPNTLNLLKDYQESTRKESF